MQRELSVKLPNHNWLICLVLTFCSICMLKYFAASTKAIRLIVLLISTMIIHYAFHFTINKPCALASQLHGAIHHHVTSHFLKKQLEHDGINITVLAHAHLILKKSSLQTFHGAWWLSSTRQPPSSFQQAVFERKTACWKEIGSAPCPEWRWR